METEDKKFLEGVGNKIKLLRELNGLLLENMADELSMSVEGYRKIEKGITNAQLCRIKQIAKILNVTIENLLNTHNNQTINFNFKTGNGFGNMHSSIKVNENDIDTELIKKTMDVVQNLMQIILNKLDSDKNI